MTLKNFSPTHLIKTAIVAVVIAQFILGIKKFSKGDFFWDLNIYADAVKKYVAGENAYELSDGNLFVYHPAVLQFFSLAGDGLKTVLIAAYIMICVFFLFFLLRHRELRLPFSLGFFYLGFGILSFVTGNVTLFLHLALIMLLFDALKPNGRVVVYICAVAIFSLIKPYLLLYLLVLPAVFARRGGHISTVAKITAIVFVLYVCVVVIHSVMFSDAFFMFYQSLKMQTIERGDLGLSVASYLRRKGVSANVALFFHVVFVCAVGLPIVYYFFFEKKYSDAGFALAIYFVLTALNPRLKEYDIPALLFTMFAALILVITCWREWFFVLVLTVFSLIGMSVKNGFFSKPEHVLFVSSVFVALFFYAKKVEVRKFLKGL